MLYCVPWVDVKGFVIHGELDVERKHQTRDDNFERTTQIDRWAEYTQTGLDTKGQTGQGVYRQTAQNTQTNGRAAKDKQNRTLKDKQLVAGFQRPVNC